jgi:hypothetical protein
LEIIPYFMGQEHYLSEFMKTEEEAGPAGSAVQESALTIQSGEDWTAKQSGSVDRHPHAALAFPA